MSSAFIKCARTWGMSLSGGERRRTEIARALAVDPKFVLLDEPFAGVDPIAVEEIQSIVAKLKSKNIRILITDHNVDETLSITDRAYLMVDGKLFKSGTAEELANDAQVRKVYLGQNFELRRAKVKQAGSTIHRKRPGSLIHYLTPQPVPELRLPSFVIFEIAVNLMGLINSILTWVMKKRIHQIELFIKYPNEVQDEIFQKLIQSARLYRVWATVQFWRNSNLR